jgi:hypothetical protein
LEFGPLEFVCYLVVLRSNQTFVVILRIIPFLSG